MKKVIDIQKKAESALKKAIKEVIVRHKQAGRPLSVWRDGKVQKVSS